MTRTDEAKSKAQRGGDHADRAKRPAREPPPAKPASISGKNPHPNYLVGGMPCDETKGLHP